jgi:selenocysteine lyase/cysteine desulfurase
MRSEGMPLWPGARRFDGASLAPSSMLGLVESIRFRRDAVGWEAGFEHARVMAGRAREVLGEIAGVELEAPTGPLATLVTFTVPGHEPEAVNLALEQRGVLARWLPRPKVVRVSVGFWTDDRDVERLATAVAGVAEGRD